MRVLCLLAMLAPCLITPAQADTTAVPKGWFLMPGTDIRMKFGGYIKLDAIHDFKPIGSPDFFNVTTIPVDGSTGSSTHYNVKETRLILDVRSEAPIGDVRGYLETDFYGTNGAFRIRRAFVDIDDHLMAGQEWTTFMDEDIIPPTLDYEKPGAYAFLRIGLIRYHTNLADNMMIAIGVEEPTASATGGDGRFSSSIPIVAARARLHGAWGHLQLSGAVGTLDYHPTSGGSQTGTLAAGNLSGIVRLGGSDKVFFQVIGGPGVAHFRSATAGVVDDANTLHMIGGYGATVGMLHSWSTAFSSTFVANYGEDNIDQYTSDPLTDRVLYAAVNLLWNYANNSFCGIEYLYGERGVVGGARGTASRLQASVRYAFNL